VLTGFVSVFCFSCVVVCLFTGAHSDMLYIYIYIYIWANPMSSRVRSHILLVASS